MRTQLAAQELHEKLLVVAGKSLEVAPADLEAEDGEIRVRGAPCRSISVREVARLILTHAFGPEASEVEPGPESTRYFRIGGTKGAGESGVTAPLGAVASAIEDALPELPLALMETPLTPERVWKAIQEANRSARA